MEPLVLVADLLSIQPVLVSTQQWTVVVSLLFKKGEGVRGIEEESTQGAKKKGK